ncbi:hypothetical protein LXL04_018692 [Taraxacum kok-saghyz]
MTTEIPCSSGQWLKQEPPHSVLKDGVLAGKTSKNNISIRTGEEFSMEFLQDRGIVNQVHNGHSNVLSNGNGNGNRHLGYEELSVMLGLQRVDSVCSSENTSVKGSLSRPNAPSAIDPVPSLAHKPSDDSQSGKIKFICSSGGKILPRPSDGKLRYVGGETRIVSIQKNITWQELVKRTSEYCNQPHTIKYQLPGEDLDALISVSSNEDLQNMIEEYNGLGNLDGSQRLRIFLIPLSEIESSCSIESNGNQQQNPDYQYVVAVNGIVDHNPNSNVTQQLLEPVSITTTSLENFPLISSDLLPKNDLMNGIEIPVLKGRAFHSDIPIPQPTDTTTDLSLGHNTSNGIPHAFSDTQLQELEGSSSTLTFTQMESVVLKQKSVELQQQHENVVIEIPNVKVKPPVSYNQTDSLQASFGSESLKTVNDASSIDKDPRKNVGVQNNSKENIPSFTHTANGDINTTSKMNYDQISVTEALHQLSNNHSGKFPVENQQHVTNGIENGQQNPWAHDPEKYLTDLLSGFSPSVQNPTTDVGHKREVSLMDEDFFIPIKQEIQAANLGHEQEYNYNKVQKDNQFQLTDLLGEVSDGLDAVSTKAHSSNATEAASTFSDSNIENAATDSGGKDGPFTNALIAEMEADMYGLQIIKNAELEELRELGSGTYGTVYHGRWRGTDVAIKRIKKSCFAGRSSEEERLTSDFWREARILSNLHHPNVVAFYGVVPDGAGGTLATVTEFMANGSLRNVLIKKDRSLDRRKKLIIAMDAAFGMEYLHSKNIVHFDLKCDNLLVNMRDPQRPVCKVGDFGLSRIKRNTLVSGGVRGTLPWMAPELLNGSTTRVSEKVDVFSFGITMWEILTGEEPYANMHCGAIIGGIVKDTLRPVIPEKCDPEWKKLMEQCWSVDPTVRPSFTEITNRLRAMSKALQTNGNGPKKGPVA